MRLVPMLLLALVAGLAAPSAAAAAAPLDGEYWYFAAASRRPQLSMSVSQGRGHVLGMARIGCLRAAVPSLPRNAFRVRADGRFRVTVPLAVRLIGRGKPRDRLVVKGRWTSPRSVQGRLRLVLRRRRPGVRVRYCDSGWRAWRAALVGSVGARTSAPETFAVPGTLTTTVTVFNDGDYASPGTQVSIAPSGDAGMDDLGDERPLTARPPPTVSPSQGTCSWPEPVDWMDDAYAGLDFGSAIRCRLGTLAARRSATITITESWPATDCVYNDEGNAFVATSWTAAVLSPRNKAFWYAEGDVPGSTGVCPLSAPPGDDG